MDGNQLTEENQMPLKSLIPLRIAEYKIRIGKKFDRKDACLKMKLSPQHLSGVINGTQQTTPERLFILADMLGCKVDELYEYVKEE